MNIPPSQTIYASNLNEKVKKEELRRSLYDLFTTYGRVLDIVALKTSKTRGQAFIVFSDIHSATFALRSLQGFAFLGKEMKLNYAKTVSNILKRLDGVYNPDSITAPSNLAIPSIHAASAEKRPREDETEVSEIATKKHHNGTEQEQDQQEEYGPHRVLYVENLPAEVTDEVVAYLFQQYSGFREVRMVPGRPDLAFVEFETAQQAGVAKEILHGFKITSEHPMKIAYAKK